MNRRLVVAVGGTALSAALLLTGCGGGTESTGNMQLSAGEALLKTSAKSAQADTFKADLHVTGTGGGDDEIRADGRFQLRPTLKFSAQLREYRKGERTMPGAEGQAVFTGDALYAKLPQLVRFLSDGKQWMKIDVSEVSRYTGFDVQGLVGQLERVSPAEQTKMFTGSDDVRRVGAETVDGVQTTHYTGTVTVEDALERLDAQEREKVRKWLPAEGANEVIDFDLWTDGENLPRKLVSKVSDGQGESGTMTVLYSEYGESFTVNPPPSDQVGEPSLGSFLGGH